MELSITCRCIPIIGFFLFFLFSTFFPVDWKCDALRRRQHFNKFSCRKSDVIRMIESGWTIKMRRNKNEIIAFPLPKIAGLSNCSKSYCQPSSTPGRVLTIVHCCSSFSRSIYSMVFFLRSIAPSFLSSLDLSLFFYSDLVSFFQSIFHMLFYLFRFSFYLSYSTCLMPFK